MCCTDVVCEVLRRMGYSLPTGALPRREDDFDAALVAEGSDWELVGRSLTALRPGLVALNRVRGLHHVSICTEPGYVMSSNQGRGVYVAPLRYVRDLVGVYRLREGAA